ncbi:MAG TPA: serine/threonine-protein kinase [Motilibacteraceae bacterium]|nr:serine/threonine-protein kinase [Motilibacteraceae bacterium]
MVADRMRRWEVPGYDVAELIGFGASGEVWLARERSTGDPVALKRLRPVPGTRRSPEAGERVAREAALLAALRHPHLLRLREVLPPADGVADGGPASGLVLVLDHAAGGSLASLLAVRGTLAPGEVVTVVAPLAEALAHVHARGLVHGDVTPANILLTGDGRPLLADLGVARLLGEQLGTVEGTPGYADPAVLAGAAPTPAADVYGLAATALTALCGPLPGSGQGVPSQPWDLPRVQGLAPTAPPPLLEVLAAALAPRPEDRPDPAELAVALHDACPPQPVRRRPARPFALDDAADDSLPVDLPAGGTGGTVLPGAASPPQGGTVGRPEAGTRVITRPRPAAAPAAPRRRRLHPSALPGRGRPTQSLGLRAVVLALALVAALAGATAVLVDRTSGAAASAAGRSEGPPATPTPTSSSREEAVRDLASARTAGTSMDGPSTAVASGATATTAPAGAGDEADWVEVMTTLYAGRSQAFAAADPAMLASVYAPGSADLASNTALVRELAADGARVPDLRLEVRQAVPVAAPSPSLGKDHVLLDVVDVLAPYELTDVGGRVLERRPGRGAQQVRVELVRVDGGWLIARTSLPAPA